MGVISSGPRAEGHAARCVPHEDSGDPDQSAVYINSVRVIETGGEPISTFRRHPTCYTATAILDACAIAFRDKPALGERAVRSDGSAGPYKWLTYEQFRDAALRCASGLLAMGVRAGDRIAMYSHSCSAFQIAFTGAQYLGAVPVAVPFPCHTKFIVDDSKARVVIMHVRWIEFAPEGVPLIVIGGGSADRGIPFENLLGSVPLVPVPASGDDLAVIIYVAATSAEPRSVPLTHANFVAGATGLSSAGFGIGEADAYFSFLPITQSYELACQLLMLAHGVRIGFFNGRLRDVFDDAAELQPTIICGVPRFFERLGALIDAKLRSCSSVVQWIVRVARQMKNEALDAREPTSMIFDYFLFSRFRAILGGRVRLIVCGAAPLAPDMFATLRTMICPNIIHGWGLPELAASGSMQEVGDVIGNVGVVSLGVDLKFRRVPGYEFDPRGERPSGEILLRGPALSVGVSEEWFATGEIGTLTSEGVVQIIDRVKPVVVLSSGEYVSLVCLNQVFEDTLGIDAIFVFADSHFAAPVAVVRPTQRMIADWGRRGISEWRDSEVARREILRNLWLRAEECGLKTFERIVGVILDDKLTCEDSRQMRQRFEASLLELYNAHGG